MKINKAKDTEFQKLSSDISIGTRSIAATANGLQRSLNTLNETGEEQEQEHVHPQQYLRQKERHKWNRLPAYKKQKFLKKGQQGSEKTKSGVKEESFYTQSKEVPERETNTSVWKGETSDSTHGKTLLQKGGTSEGVKGQTAKGASTGAKGAAGAASGGTLLVATQAKKTADKFVESLQAQNIRTKLEAVREDNKDRQGFMQLGKYMGATVGILLTPAISAIGSLAATIVGSVLITGLAIGSALLPIILIVVLLATLLFGVEDSMEASRGYFGAKYYWIEYETGKTDESAFATVLGDNGAAFGIQFDYRYTLQPFMQYCYNSDPVAYSLFVPYLTVDKSTLKGNQGLANAWIMVYQNNKDNFILMQKTYANDRYYVPAETQLEAAGIKIKDRSEVCKGAVLSFMFQGCSMGIKAAVINAGITNSSSDEEFIRKLYAYRSEHYSRFQSRYEREVQTALSLLYGEGVVVGSGYLCNPCPEAYISSEFGPRSSPGGIGSTNHKGRDYAAASGTKIYAAQAGTVETVASNGVRGNYLVINHGNGIKTLYQHCTTIFVHEGSAVKKGAPIATVGTTGAVTGAHLHFEVHENGTPVDPRNYL